MGLDTIDPIKARRFVMLAPRHNILNHSCTIRTTNPILWFLIYEEAFNIQNLIHEDIGEGHAWRKLLAHLVLRQGYF